MHSVAARGWSKLVFLSHFSLSWISHLLFIYNRDSQSKSISCARGKDLVLLYPPCLWTNESLKHMFSSISSLVSPQETFDTTRFSNFQEISDVVFSTSRNKSLGSNGFSVDFYIVWWDIISMDVVRAIKKIFVTKSSHGAGKPPLLHIPKVHTQLAS